MKYTPPSAPQSIGGVLDDWLRLFRCSFRRCWVLALIAAVAGIFPQLLLAPTAYHPGMPLSQYIARMADTILSFRVIAGDLLFYLVLVVVYGALLTQQLAVVRGDDSVAFGTALANGLRRLPRTVLTGILLFLIAAALLVPIVVDTAVLVPLHRTAATITLAIVVNLTLIVLGIYLWVRLEFWMPAIFADDCGAAGALGQSWRLVKGHWWRVTAITFVAGVIVWILSLAIGGIAGAIVGLLFGIGAPALVPETLVRIRIFSAIGELAARVITMPLLTAVWLAIYRDLKLRREGTDLAARTQALGGT